MEQAAAQATVDPASDGDMSNPRLRLLPGADGLRLHGVLPCCLASCYLRCMSKPTKAPHFPLNVLLYREDGVWTAHCLQLDLVECARTLEQAQANMLDVIRAHIEHALEHDNMEHLFHPAPAEYWQLFLRSTPIGTRTVRLHSGRGHLRAVPRVTVAESSVRKLAA